MIDSKTRKTRKPIISFSPSINRLLPIKSLKSGKKDKINFCDSLLKVKINNICRNYNDKKVIKLLLNILKTSKHLDPDKFIAPKQIKANCWFNTMFVTFFFSDKGRKFFRFFRTLMITGKKYDNTIIKNINIRKLFFILNLYIEASYNNFNNFKTSKKSITYKKSKNELYNKLNLLTDNLNTNYFIKEIYNEINNEIYKSKKISVPNIDMAGNPLVYYLSIMKYLNYNVLKIMKLEITKHMIVNNKLYTYIDNNYNNYINIPDIIIIEDHESELNNYECVYKFNKNNIVYTYKLDSIIITNKNFYNPRSNKHFVSVLTINKQEYKFDGSSYSKLSKFRWKNIININIDWAFKENPHYYPEKYNFTKGYKIMFYYRV